MFSEIKPRFKNMFKTKYQNCCKLFLVIGFVYLFLVSIGLMSTAFKGFGSEFAENLIQTTSNPFIGLFIGILATSIVQSSSTTTSIIIGMVGGGVITMTNAIPIIMGANIGTTVTGILVSLGHIGRREEFRRAVSGGTLDGFFKIMCVCILFPIELATGVLGKMAVWISSMFVNIGGIKFTSPIKLATKPLIRFMQSMIMKVEFLQNIVNVVLLIVSLVFLFCSLYFIVKIMRSLVVKRAEIILNNVIGKYGILAIFVSLLFTAVIQSSSITVALMIPLIAAGILTVETMYPIVMGANIGTTVTAILASFATGNIAAVTTAFVHFLFNTVGLLIIYPLKPLRRIPVFLAKNLGNLAFKKRRYAIIYTLIVFFIIPVMFILISQLF
ncbi:MAG: Na/Pi symporter [Candidatus Saelkia tenebricola]|nr:Na/Pi symporter [Candidatus Saelkia tenebricola]